MAEAHPKFDWDAANTGHLARHGVTPAEFEQGIRNDPVFVAEYETGGERRNRVVSATDDGRLLELVYTVRAGRIRAVTAFPLKRKMREAYRGQLEK